MKEVFMYAKNWFEVPTTQLTVLEKFAKIIVILALVKITLKISYLLINNFFKKQNKFKFKIEKKKADTLSAVLKSVIRYTLYFIAIVPILEVFDINTTAILATISVGGLAIGFGAQNLVRDIITGFFILLEDQFSVGDYIKTGDFDGIVEEIGIRVTKIRGFSGELFIIPNGKIEMVTNKSRGAMRAWVDISIAYEEDIDNAIEALNEVAKNISKTSEDIIEGPTVLGVTNFGESDVVLSVIAKTKPMQQWAVEREIRKKIKQQFDKKGIEIPYPKRVVVKSE